MNNDELMLLRIQLSYEGSINGGADEPGKTCLASCVTIVPLKLCLSSNLVGKVLRKLTTHWPGWCHRVSTNAHQRSTTITVISG